MPNLISAGLLMCRWRGEDLEYFLVHPGGPFFKNKDAGVWSIPKGIPENGEELLDAAVREFREETGINPSPPYYKLSNIRQKNGKTVHAWAFLGNWNPEIGIHSNLFKLEWPPRSGKFQEFPEQDKAAWLDFDRARVAINPAQVALLEEARSVMNNIKK